METNTQPMYQRLRHYIDDVAQLSRKQVALNAKMTESHLSLILSGRRGLKIDDYERLCRAIAVNPARFFTSQ